MIWEFGRHSSVILLKDRILPFFRPIFRAQIFKIKKNNYYPIYQIKNIFKKKKKVNQKLFHSADIRKMKNQPVRFYRGFRVLRPRIGRP